MKSPLEYMRELIQFGNKREIKTAVEKDEAELEFIKQNASDNFISLGFFRERITQLEQAIKEGREALG